MRKIFNSTLVSLILLSSLLPLYASAHEESTKVIDIAKDCEFIYVLRRSEIQKLSLPSFTVIKSVKLPSLTRGDNVTLAGECSDPSETVLVSVKRKGPGSDKVLLSYNEDLQLIAQIDIGENDDDDDNDHH